MWNGDPAKQTPVRHPARTLSVVCPITKRMLPAVSENTGVVMAILARAWLSPKMYRASVLKALLPAPAGLTDTCEQAEGTEGVCGCILGGYEVMGVL